MNEEKTASKSTVKILVRPLIREIGLIPTRLYLLRAGYTPKHQREFTARIKKTVEEGIAKQRALRPNAKNDRLSTAGKKD